MAGGKPLSVTDRVAACQWQCEQMQGSLPGGGVMDIQRDVRVAGQMPCCFLEGTENGIFYKSMVERWELQNVSALEAQLFYNLGLIHGKREERARRKKK